MRDSRVCLVAVTVLTLVLAGCQPAKPEPAASPELQAALKASDERVGGFPPDVHRFYDLRQHSLAWVSKGRPSKDSPLAIEVLRSARRHGLNPADYDADSLSARHEALANGDAKPSDADLADFDVRLTAALLELARHVAVGRLSPDVIDDRWQSRREMPDLAGALAEAQRADIEGLLARVQPRHPEYAALVKAIAEQDVLTAAGRTAAVPRTAQEIKVFQEHHGLKATGTLDAATRAALAVPVERRIEQIALNLERWRWLPDDLGERHFLVNVPEFHLHAREHGKTVFDIRVVVGKKGGNETPLFSDEMSTVVFSPYWNIPETIVVDETAPTVARDPGYLARNQIEVVRVSGENVEVVDPAEVSWDDPESLKALSFRQRPGAQNALGFVKFLFPNPHAVYIHDTPADALFARVGRALSHGCVRVEEPEKLAQYVLRDQSQWTPEAIGVAMRSGTEKHVKLNQPIPVHIVYFTAWVDSGGGLQFRDDVYGYDARQARAKPGGGGARQTARR